MSRIIPLLMVTALLAACVPSETPVSSRAPAGVVSFTPVKEDRGGYCIVGFTVTYPEGIAAHKRRITVKEPALGTSNSYDLPIPPLGPPDAFTRQGSMITFARLGEATIDPCGPQLAQRTLIVGACTEGQCAPARFVPDASLDSLGLNGRVQE